MKTLAYILFFLICTLLVINCAPDTHKNCARKAQELRKVNRGNVAQFAHYLRK